MSSTQSLFNIPAGISLSNNVSILSGSTIPSGTVDLTVEVGVGSVFLEGSTGLLYTLVSSDSAAATGAWTPLSSQSAASSSSQSYTVSTIQSLYSIINAMQNQVNSIGSQFIVSTVNQTASGMSVIDTAPSNLVKWIVTATDTVTNYINSTEILAVYNDVLGDTSYSLYGQIQTGGAIAGLEYNISTTTSGTPTGIVLTVGGTNPLNITSTRLTISQVSTNTLPASATIINNIVGTVVNNPTQTVTNIAYTYNTANQVSQINEDVNGLPRVTTITYNTNGTIDTESVTYNGTTTTNTYTYNSNNLITNISTTIS